MTDLDSNSIETGVDKLLQFIKGKGRVDLALVAKQLGMTTSALQLWVDFLVEEKIIGVDYKFTKPYIYLIEKKETDEGSVSKELGKYKKQFVTEAKKRAVPESKTAFLWKDHLQQKIESKKEFFYEQAALRNLEDIDTLWKTYKKSMMVN